MVSIFVTSCCKFTLDEFIRMTHDYRVRMMCLISYRTQFEYDSIESSL